ncbi:hypothetical protein E5F05_20330 [Deinococcus metallilatus]|uniref:Uncharacterized protein n=1 Tax=Deinococcus metallilatus TaxID=1211322 RepID=A0AAJ5F0C5_9DEIO|nr:hypothetical protein [Deinococcus metallilatus]MBB5297129.1 hypothetical protein [Deinococcus metallilatus]QBY10084.1 hypothetical protein E5F05_20330 [Deinococcus metallilatus]RXJ08339.1 hypothetical protein ERJ73_19170 [Deinococcus metallilatus]TLK21951.1 hypothetical protein FCS05_18315 [Deinococcus metallilatus]GMA17306.1 hypothetical protein GCM10025871_36370 [Deinococcus metallilatus]
MAHPDLRGLVPPEAARAFTAGDEWLALTLLRRARDAQAPGTVNWAVLERLVGLVLIHVLREVEGTFALERADALLDAAGQPRPGLDWLEAGLAG